MKIGQRGQNLLLFTVSLIGSLILCEMGLRIFTPFPITKSSNKIQDPNLGYRLSPGLADVDTSGFRNPSDTQHVLAAVGDSHTYGVNVPSAQSWPAALQSRSGIQTYNFGVGSYGVYSYHALIRENIAGKFKGVVVALYLANDFADKHSYCAISRNSTFWKQETKKLSLEIPKCSGLTVYIGGKKIWPYIRDATAITSAFKHLVIDRISAADRKGPKAKDYYEIPGTQESINLPRARKHMRSMDLERREIRLILSDFSRMLKRWSEISGESNLLLGIMIVPSKPRVLIEYAKQRDNFRLSKTLQDFLQKEVALEAGIIKQAQDAGIPVESAIGPLLKAKELAEQKKLPLYRAGDSHPNALGYRAYAQAALNLIRRGCDGHKGNSICAQSLARWAEPDQ